MKQLEKAIRIAVEAHAGQFDKGGKPYILHPLHLMTQLMFDVDLATIAILHDVIEDSRYTTFDLQDEGFSFRVVHAVGLLTHRKDVSYADYILGISHSYDAIRVKRKDLEHNSDITRLKGVTKKDLERIEKYHKAFTLLGKAKKGVQMIKVIGKNTSITKTTTCRNCGNRLEYMPIDVEKSLHTDYTGCTDTVKTIRCTCGYRISV